MTSIRLCAAVAPATSSVVSGCSRGSVGAGAIALWLTPPVGGRYALGGATLRLRDPCRRPHAWLYFCPHSSTHPEGWRDMALRDPGNLPKGNGANSIRLQRQAWEMWVGRFRRPPTTDP